MSPTVPPGHLDEPRPAATASRTHPATTAAAMIVLALLLLPFVPLVVTSLADGYFHPQVIPDRWSGRAWSIVLDANGQGLPALRDSALIAAAVTALSLLVAVPAGRTLGTRTFRGKRAVEMILLAPVVVPAIAVAMGLHVVFLRAGLAGNSLGVVLVHLVPAMPYVVLLSAGVFANADLELEAQARSLGATWWQARRHVTLRLVAPGLVVAGLFGFLVSWGQYALTLVIGSGRVLTLPILVFAAASGGDASVTAATALLHAVPAIVMLIVMSRVLGSRGTSTLGGAR